MAAATAKRRALGKLPQWDLGDLYPGRDSPELKRDLDAGEAEGKAFRAQYEGRLAQLSGAGLGAAIAQYERLQERLGRVIELCLARPCRRHERSRRSAASTRRCRSA